MSRSCSVPHFGQIHFRTARSFTFIFLCPQHPHVWEDGYHLLTLRKYFPERSILYFTMLRNCDQPTEAMDFARHRFFIMFLTARSSQIKAMQLSVIALASLWWKSFRWSVVLRCSFATFRRAFSQFLEPVCVFLSYCFLERLF